MPAHGLDQRRTSEIGRTTTRLLRERGDRVLITGQDPTTSPARPELPDDVLGVRADARSLTDAEDLARTGQRP